MRERERERYGIIELNGIGDDDDDDGSGPGCLEMGSSKYLYICCVCIYRLGFIMGQIKNKMQKK